MNLTSTNTNSLNGEIICPGDKSISQRILILGSLLNCDMEISGFLDANDPNSTLNALNEIGASIKKSGSKVILCKRELPFIKPSQNLDLGNSGTGMRLMIGLISGLGINATLVGDSSLSKRPMSRVIKPLKEMGAKIQSNEGKSPIEILESNISSEFEYKMPIASAQVKSSLILASLSSNNSITIIEPKITRDHTERMIEYFGGSVTHSNDEIGRITVDNSKLTSKDSYEIVGDFSSAAFVIVATLISRESKVIIKNVGLNPTRCGLLEILVLMGANIEIRNQKITCNEESGDIFVKSSYLNGIDVPEDIIPNIIDEIPILSIAASFAKGETFITEAEELRVKESDRLQAISDGLQKINIHHELFHDGIKITGSSEDISHMAEIDSHGDHRIAMSFLIASLRSKKGIYVEDCKNILTSFPNFIEVMSSLGISINER